MALKTGFWGDDSESVLGANYLVAALALWNAAESRLTMPPPRFLVPHHDLATGYRMQALNVRRWQASGRKIVGYKVGMTSAAVQTQFGVNKPTRGVLFNSMVHASGARLRLPVAGAQALAEGEIAFVLRDNVNPSPTLGDILDSLDYAIPAIEIANSRVENWNITAFDFVADNAAAEFVILGSRRIDCKVVNWQTVSMRMEVNGQCHAEGKGADCLGSPLNALHWLALDLAENGHALKKGDVVMSGSLGQAVPVRAGDQVAMYMDHDAAVTIELQ